MLGDFQSLIRGLTVIFMLGQLFREVDGNYCWVNP